MNISRRQFLADAALAVPAIALVGCGLTSEQTQQIAASVAQDANTLAAGLNAILPQLPALGVSADDISKAQTAIADLQKAAAALSTASSNAAAIPSVQQIANDVSAVMAALGPSLPPPVGPALTAASVLVPVIEAAVGMVVAPTASVMTPDEARAILKATAAR